MPRRSYRKSVKVTAKSNWSHENKGCLMTPATENPVNGLYQSGSVVVPSIATQGTRTVGRFSITVPAPLASSAQNEIYWALVYVPQGTNANNLFAVSGTPEGSLYEPNQYVMASGITDGTAGPIRIRSNIMRKLHSGDFISLIIGTIVAQSTTNQCRALVSYSVKYN